MKQTNKRQTWTRTYELSRGRYVALKGSAIPDLFMTPVIFITNRYSPGNWNK